MAKTAIEFDGFKTKHTDRRFAGEFDYTDPTGRRFTLDTEELTVAEEGCTGEVVTATVGLPDPGTEAAHLLLAAVLTAMDMQDDYEVVKKS